MITLQTIICTPNANQSWIFGRKLYIVSVETKNFHLFVI